MRNDMAVRLWVNGGVDVAACIFIFCLSRYNKILYDIQGNYSTKFEQAWNMVQEPNFLIYLIVGAIFVLLLVGISLYQVCVLEDIEIRTVLMIAANVCILILLIHVYSNPVFTAFACVVSGMGVFVKAVEN